MNKNKGPDERNLGGRQEITNNMFHHHKNMLNVKPTINRFDRPKTHVDANKKSKLKQPIYKELEQFSEVFESFKKVAQIKKGGTDTNPPQSYQFKKMLNSKANKQSSFVLTEHQKNLQSQKQKINSIGRSMQERKKNTFDPVAYPSLFFRRKNESKKDISIDQLFSRIAQQQRIQESYKIDPENVQKQTMPKLLSEKQQQEINYGLLNSTSQQQQQQFGSVKRLDKYGMEQKDNNENKFLIEVPQTNEEGEKGIEELKGQLIELIIKYRLYKNEDLDSLFTRMILYNQHLDQNLIQQMFQKVKNDLDAQ